MTKDDILRMGREAGMHDPMIFIGAYERFANRVYALAAAAEREECAKVCDDHEQYPSLTPRHCAAAIRARGDK